MRDYIFLDVDGVLNRFGTEDGRWPRTTDRIDGGMLIGLEPELVARFLKLVEETNALVVLCSSWRHYRDCKRYLREKGVTWVDKTGDAPSRFRGREIQAWVRAHRKEIRRYVILDDDRDFFKTQPHFRIDGRRGLQEYTCTLVKAFFRNPQ